ncbi:MAG: hypothetical protein ACOC35_03845 [Promethearchaeia archaeon]
MQNSRTSENEIKTIRYYKGVLKCKKLLKGADFMGKSLYKALVNKTIKNRAFTRGQLFCAPVRLCWTHKK